MISTLYKYLAGLVALVLGGLAAYFAGTRQGRSEAEKEEAENALEIEANAMHILEEGRKRHDKIVNSDNSDLDHFN